MTIDRSTMFRQAWKSAKGTASGYPNLRAAFAAALRRVWSLVKAMAVEAARKPYVAPTRSHLSGAWESANVYRARAVANRLARLGNYYTHAW